MNTLFKLVSLLLSLFLIGSCVSIKPWEKEKLADPIMEPQSQFAKQKLDVKFFTSREGSIGGGGIGGGCGCAK